MEVNKLYKELEIDPGSDNDTIKKAYRKAAMKHHPDKGGDPEKFKKISEAADILLDPKKKAIYENRKMNNPFEGVVDPMDIFNSFFGNSFFGNGRSDPQSEDFKNIELKLEEIYSGKNVRLKINRKLCCQGCDGIGGLGKVTCKECNGFGQVTRIMNMGAGMVQRITTVCNRCNGRGETIKNICELCHGKGLIDDVHIQDVQIPAGVKHGEIISIRGQGNYNKLRRTYNDINIRVLEKKHQIFERRRNDLIMRKNVTIGEMICGTTYTHTHLNGDTINIDVSGPIDIGKMYKVNGYGMKKGDLLIIHELKIERLNEKDVQIIKKMLNVRRDTSYDISAYKLI